MINRAAALLTVTRARAGKGGSHWRHPAQIPNTDRRLDRFQSASRTYAASATMSFDMALSGDRRSIKVPKTFSEFLMRGTTSLSQGLVELKKLRSEIEAAPAQMNEADTRLHIIDRIITDCLGWPKRPSEFKVEHSEGGKFFDYLLGNPATVVWEAKKSGIYFDLPADVDKVIWRKLKDIYAASDILRMAIDQVQSYCNSSGVELAIICNGRQIIAFLAVRVGHKWLDGKALVFSSLQQIEDEFSTFWQCLSPDGVLEKRLARILTKGVSKSIPRKLSTHLIKFPSFRYKGDLQTNLRTLGELLLEDIAATDALRSQFYRECYCETGSLSRDALVSHRILEARYTALFPSAEDAPRLIPAAQSDSAPSLSDQVMSEALARRPIVLLGDVGVGKTSFLEELMEVRASREFERSIHIYINLGSQAALEEDLKKFVIREIETQLFEKYAVDIYEWNFVRGVYDLEVKRFRSSFKAAIYRNKKDRLDDELNKKIDEFTASKSEHLRRSLAHVALARRRQIIIMIDNADQRDSEVQTAAFIIAQDFAQNWNALVFIAVRPQTFFQSKRAGALSAYPHKVFTILPPRPELVIEKRLVFALKVAEGKIPSDRLSGVTLSIGNLALFLRALLNSIQYNRDLTEILANITGGNIRAVLEFVTKFIGSPNVEAEKIIRIQSQSGRYIIPIHEFSKAAILGDYSHFVPSSSLALNLFDVGTHDPREHFLALMVISFLLSNNSTKDRNEFVHTSEIFQEMQQWSFLPDQTEKALRRLTNKKLIETTERVTFEEDVTGLIGDMPEGFRSTSIGAYHFRRWAGEFSYLDAMVFDTPIFDEVSSETLIHRVSSFDIADRYQRAILFRDYLSQCWADSLLAPAYFDWSEVVKQGSHTFDSVARAVGAIRSH